MYKRDEKRVLLVGSSFSAAPIFFALKNRGFHITVCGSLRSDPCHLYADESIYVDYSKQDELLDAISGRNFDFIVPTCNDYSYLAASWCAEKLNLPGFDTTETTNVLHTKKLFRDRAEAFHLPAPRLVDENNLFKKNLNPPYIVKPIDSFSGRGVTKVESIELMSDAIAEACSVSRSKEVVIEEYVDGSLHSHSAFISNKHVVIDFFVDEFCTTYPYQVNCSNHPSNLGGEIREAVRLAIERLAVEFDLVDGLLHTQFIVNGDNFWIIECMRRSPGDLYGTLIQRSTGINYADLFILPFINEPYPPKISNLSNLYFGRHTVSTELPLINFSITSAIDSKKSEIVQLKCCGEKVLAAPFDKVAIMLIKFDSKETMLRDTPKLSEMVSIITP